MLHRQAFHVPPMAAGTALTLDAAERTNNQDARLHATFGTRGLKGRLREVHATAFALSADLWINFVTGQPVPDGGDRTIRQSEASCAGSKHPQEFTREVTSIGEPDLPHHLTNGERRPLE
jgi:hypothetical protein